MLQGWLIKLATTKKRSRSLTDFGSDRISLLVRVEPEDGPISTCARVSSECSPGGDCHLLWVGRRTASGERFNPAGIPPRPRCGARTRRGSQCQSPAMPNGRCRMHGGMSPGAPKGNKNAFKHGRYAAEAIALRRDVAALLRAMKTLADSE